MIFSPFVAFFILSLSWFFFRLIPLQQQKLAEVLLFFSPLTLSACLPACPPPPTLSGSFFFWSFQGDCLLALLAQTALSPLFTLHTHTHTCPAIHTHIHISYIHIPSSHTLHTSSTSQAYITYIHHTQIKQDRDRTGTVDLELTKNSQGFSAPSSITHAFTHTHTHTPTHPRSQPFCPSTTHHPSTHTYTSPHLGKRNT